MIPLQQWQQHRDAARLDSDARQREAALAEWVDLCLEVAASIRLSEVAENIAQTIAQLRDWIEQQDTRLHDHVEERVAAVQERLSTSVTASVVPLLRQSIRQKAVEDFCQALMRQANDEIREAFVINAPSDLHEALAESLVACGITAEIRPSDDQEISAKCGPAKLRTAIESWTDELLGILKHEV
jgi:hypothetical protein